jgi:hypothetical protein
LKTIFYKLRIYLANVRIVTTTLSITIFISLISLSQIKQADYNLENRKSIGIIMFKNNNVERKIDGKVVWNKSENNTILYSKDTIRTDKDSSVIIKLNDETEIRIDENTMVMIDLNEKESKIELLKGTLRAIRSSNSKVPLNIKILEKILAILEDGDVNLKKTESVSISVNRGLMKLLYDGKEFLVKLNQFFSINEKGTVNLLSVAPVLIYPEDQKFFVSKEKYLSIDFQWNSNIKNGNSRIEFSSDRNFTTISHSELVSNSSFKKEFGYGITYWRVINTIKGNDEISLERKFTVLKEEEQIVFFPTNNISKTSNEFPKTILFKWKENYLIKDYTIEISKDKDFKDIEKVFTTTQSQIGIELDKEGIYYYRFKVNFNHPDIPSKRTAIQKFELVKNISTNPPLLISPVENSEIIFSNNMKLSLIFEWSEKEGNDSYLIQISKDSEFTKMIHEEVVYSNIYFLNKDLKEDEYYWRVKVLNSKKDILNISLVSKFFVKKENVQILLLSPENNLKFINDKQLPVLKWKSDLKINKFTIELSSDSKFEKVISKYSTRKKLFILSNLTKGKYFWRVTDETSKSKSNIFSFELKDDLNENLPPEIDVEDNTYFINK